MSERWVPVKDIPEHLDAVEMKLAAAMTLGDLPAVFELLENTRPEPATVERAMGSGEPSVVHAAVLHVRRRINEGGPTSQRAAWVDLLPGDLGALPSETQRLLAEVWLELPSTHALPNWQSADLAPEVFVAWLRAQLVHRPRAVTEFSTGFALRAAVRDIPLERIPSAGLVVEHLCKHDDPAIQRQAMRYMDAALRLGSLRPSVAHELLAQLLDSANDVVVVEATRRLRACWATLIPDCPQKRLLALLGREWQVAREAASTLAARGEVESLVLLLEEDDADAYLQRACMEELAETGDKQHVRIVLERALSDLLFFGPTAIKTLLTLRRRGMVCSRDEAAAVFGIYIESTGIDADDVAEVLSPHLGVCIDGISVVQASPRPPWRRIVELLVAFGCNDASAKLRQILAEESCRDGWAETILALGELKVASAELLILSRLHEEPEACVDALVQIGSAPTVARLEDELFDASLEVRPAWHEEAAKLLYQLRPGPETLEKLRGHGLLSASVLAALPICASIDETKLLGDLAQQPGHPLRQSALRSLGQAAGVHGIAPLAQALDDRDEDIRELAQSALRDLGRRLYRYGVSRPPCLVDATSAEEGGNLLLADCLLARLGEGRLDDQQLQLLLEALAGHSHPHLLRGLGRFLRHRNPHVKKHAIQCLGAYGEQKVIPWLLPFAETEDIYILRQALLALGDLGRDWTASTILASLDHPNMNIKKTAIASLRGTTSAAVVPKILFWLSRHDNPGLRTELVGVLKGVLKSDLVTVVASALDVASAKRSWELLLLTLSCEVSLDFVANQVAGDHPWTPTMLSLIYAGALQLEDGDVVSLEAELARRGLEDRLPRVFDPPSFVSTEMAREGIDFGRAVTRLLQLLAQRPPGSEPSEEMVRAVSRLGSDDGTDGQRRKLRPHLHQLIAMYASLPAEGKRGLLSIFSANASAMTGLEKARVAWTVREFWDEDLSDRADRVLSQMGAVLSPTLARRLLADRSSAGADRAIRALLWAAPEEPELDGLLVSHESHVLSFFVEDGRFEDCFERSQAAGSALGCAAVVGAVVEHEGEGAALALTRELLGDPRLAHRYLPSVMTRFDGARAEALLLDVQRNKSLTVELRAMAASKLASRPSAQTHAALESAARDEHVDVRVEAATALSRWSDRQPRPDILKLYLEGRLGQWSPAFALARTDLAHAIASVRRPVTPEDDARLLRLVDLLARSSPPRFETISALVRIWQEGLSRSAPAARDALRSMPVRCVLPVVYPSLRRGVWSCLDVLGLERDISEPLVGLFPRADAHGRRQLFAYYDRQANHGPLYSPSLGETLVSCLERGEEVEAALSTLARLTDWYDAEHALTLGACLRRLVKESPRRESAVVEALLEGTDGQPAVLQVRIFAALGGIAKHPAMMTRIAEAQIDDPASAALLDSSTSAAVSRHLRSLVSHRDPELVRRVITYLAQTQEGEETVELLEEMLAHRSSRVRLQAHRLLRRHVSRERYLRATVTLLTDANPEIIRRAIRALTYGGHVEAAKQIVSLLQHKDKNVRQAAHRGLLVLGDEAISPLRRALKRERPDKRDTIEAVLVEIERGATGECCSESTGS